MAAFEKPTLPRITSSLLSPSSEVERAHLGLEERDDAARRLVEEGEERHRPRGERDEVEDPVEPLVASFVNGGADRACHPPSHPAPSIAARDGWRHPPGAIPREERPTV